MSSIVVSTVSLILNFQIFLTCKILRDSPIRAENSNVSSVFDVQGSVHRKYIRFDIFPTRSNFTQFISF